MTVHAYGRVLSHPARIEILQVMAAERWSPSMLASELDVPLPRMSYHVRELAAIGILKRAGSRPVRGALEHFYRADPTFQSKLLAVLAIIENQHEAAPPEALPEAA